MHGQLSTYYIESRPCIPAGNVRKHALHENYARLRRCPLEGEYSIPMAQTSAAADHRDTLEARAVHCLALPHNDLLETE